MHSHLNFSVVGMRYWRATLTASTPSTRGCIWADDRDGGALPLGRALALPPSRACPALAQFVCS